MKSCRRGVLALCAELLRLNHVSIQVRVGRSRFVWLVLRVVKLEDGCFPIVIPMLCVHTGVLVCTDIQVDHVLILHPLWPLVGVLLACPLFFGCGDVHG